MAISQQVIQEVQRRSKGLCELCGKRPRFPNRITYHHALVHRAKRHPEYDHHFNLESCCLACHDSIANSYKKNERQFYALVCSYYGKETIDNWIDSLGLKVREYWD